MNLVVGGLNAAPAAQDDTITARRKTVNIKVLANDSDPDGDKLTVTAVTPPAHGRGKISSKRIIRYTPKAGATGTDQFTYIITDGKGGTATARVTIQLGGNR